jgi:hypothetical protein
MELWAQAIVYPPSPSDNNGCMLRLFECAGNAEPPPPAPAACGTIFGMFRCAEVNLVLLLLVRFGSVTGGVW